MNLLKIYNDVDKVLNSLDFNSLFAGFHKYQYAIYTSKEICLNGEIIPYQDSFRGNTSIEYNGEYIAIWNMEFDFVDDVEELAYQLVHEMFHCHQRANNEERYPSDLDLLAYPHDTDNFEKKYNENLYLAESYEKHNLEALQKFVYIRNMRMKVYPEMVRQELKSETLEGTAEYVGLKALQKINYQKFTAVVNDYIDKLRKQDSLLFDVRRISYYSGALYYLSCDDNGIVLQNNFTEELTVYEQNPIAFYDGSVEIKHYNFISNKLAEMLMEREKIIIECIGKWKYVVCDAFICGYDPMNMFRFKDLIYCKYFVCLNINGVVQNFNSKVILKLAEHSNQNVVGYYIE